MKKTKIIILLAILVFMFTSCKPVSEPEELSLPSEERISVQNHLQEWSDYDEKWSANGDLNEEESFDYPAVLMPTSSNGIEAAFYTEGLFCLFDGESYGYMDESGQEITGFLYDFAYPYSQGLACVRRDEKYGYLDSNGRIAIPFLYDKATPFQEGLAYFEIGDKYGFIDRTGKEQLLLDCDSISSFHEDLAYYSLDGQYGVLDNKGVIIQPFEYEGIRLFEENDCSSVKKDGKWILLDNNGNQISKKAYDSITEFGDGYLCEESSRFGILNRKGEEIQAPIFSYGMDYAYYTENCYITRCVNSGERENGIVIKKEIEKKDTSELLINEITPRIKQYHEFIKDGHMSIKEWENDFGITMDQLEHNKLTYQLWRLGNFDLPVLYVFAQSYSSTPYPLTYSGFYCIEDNQLQELLIGYECGGSIGGNYVNLWYDKMEKLIKLGSTGTYGGFGGNALDADIYDYEKGSLKAPLSFSRVRQSVANYGEEMVQNAHLFYDDSNIPYTEESILQAEIVIAYYVNGEQTTLENYTESFSNRFRAIP